MEKNYFGAIEFGSLYTNILIVSYHHNKIDVVATAKVESAGFYNGEITDLDAFNDSLSEALNEVLKKYKILLDEVILVLPSNNHKVYCAKVSNKVLTERQIIGKVQIESIRSNIKKAQIGADETLVYEIPTLYTLDSDRVLRSAPINYQSSTLTITSNIHTLPKTIVENLRNALILKKVSILGQYINCNCNAVATSHNYDLEGECIVVNFGQEVTTISGFSKNLLVKSININFGIDTLITYLAYNLKVDKKYAKTLFESYFVCDNEYSSDVIFDEENNLSEKRISGIILNRLYTGFNEILDSCLKLKADCKFADDVKYLVTGLLNDYEFFISELVKYSSLEIKEGSINVVGINEQSYVNCYGAILMFIEENQELISSRLENDEEIDLTVNNNNNVNNVNDDNSDNNSRFRDIFDD